ncbi:metal-sensitive transcriptional regulator [Halanaerobaculum tunisiense]
MNSCQEGCQEDSSYQDQKEDLIGRLNRVEGQIRGLKRMIDEDKYCVDVLNQIAAVKGALNKVGMSVLEAHTKGCVTDTIVAKEEQKETDDKIEELMDVIFKFTNK